MAEVSIVEFSLSIGIDVFRVVNRISDVVAIYVIIAVETGSADESPIRTER